MNGEKVIQQMNKHVYKTKIHELEAEYNLMKKIYKYI